MTYPLRARENFPHARTLQPLTNQKKLTDESFISQYAYPEYERINFASWIITDEFIFLTKFFIWSSSTQFRKTTVNALPKLSSIVTSKDYKLVFISIPFGGNMLAERLKFCISTNKKCFWANPSTNYPRNFTTVMVWDRPPLLHQIMTAQLI